MVPYFRRQSRFHLEEAGRPAQQNDSRICIFLLLILVMRHIGAQSRPWVNFRKDIVQTLGELYDNNPALNTVI